MLKEFDYLKNEFPKIYKDIVLEHKAVNKVLTFCDDESQYLLFTGMFTGVNSGKGITEELETYLVNFLFIYLFITLFKHKLSFNLIPYGRLFF